MSCQLQSIYLRHCTVNLSPDFVPVPKAEHTLDYQLGVNHRDLGESQYEVTLTLVAKSQQGDKANVQIQYAGLFLIKDMTPEQQELLLQTQCPQVLLPFIRERALELTRQAGLSSLELPLINFTQVNQQQKQAAQNPSTAASMH